MSCLAKPVLTRRNLHTAVDEIYKMFRIYHSQNVCYFFETKVLTVLVENLHSLIR